MENIVSNPENDATTAGGSRDSQETTHVIQNAKPQSGCKGVVDSKKRMDPPRNLPSGPYQMPMHNRPRNGCPHIDRGFGASSNSPNVQPLMGNGVWKSKENPMPMLAMMKTRWPITQNVSTEIVVEASSEAPTTSAPVTKQVKEQSSTKLRSLYSINSASADGKICKITMANSNSRFVIRTMFKTFLNPVLMKLNLQLPVNFDSFSENELRNFVNTYNSHLRNSDSAVKMGEFLTAKECEKKSIQDLMFYFAYLIKTSEGLLNIKSGRELTERYEGFMANLDMNFHVEKDFTMNFIRNYDVRIGKEAIQAEIKAADEAVALARQAAARRAQDRQAVFARTGAGGSSANIRKPEAQLIPGRPAATKVKRGSGAQVQALSGALSSFRSTAGLTSAQRPVAFQGAASSAQAGRGPRATPFMASLGTGIGRPVVPRRMLENPAARAVHVQSGAQPGTTANRSESGIETVVGASAIRASGGHVPAPESAATSVSTTEATPVPVGRSVGASSEAGTSSEPMKKTSKRKAKDDGVASKKAKMDGSAGTCSAPMD